MVEEIKAYKTSDNKIFESQSLAIEHETQFQIANRVKNLAEMWFPTFNPWSK